MPSEGQVLYRSKQVSKLLAGVPLVFAVVFAVFGGLLAAGVLAPVPQLLSLLAFGVAGMNAFLGLTMSGLRSVLTSEELRIQLGLWGPRIPLSAIESCKVVDYDVRKYGGYGLKFHNGIRIYSAPGSEQAIALRYADESGSRRQVVFTADDPVALANEIHQTRKVRIATGGAARIAADGDDRAEQEALAEQELLDAEQSAAKGETASRSE